MSKTIETDLKTFIKFWLVPLGIALSILFIYKAATGLIIIGASIFLALALRPLVRKVNGLFERLFKQKRYHATSVILAYLLVIAIFGAAIAIIGPVVVDQTAKFIEQVPTTFEENLGGWEGINNIGKTFGIENVQNEIGAAIKNLSENIIANFGSTVVTGIGNIADTLTKIALTLILTLLFLLEGPHINAVFWKKLKSDKEDRATIQVAQNTISKMANVVSTYVSHQVFVALIDGFASMLIVFVLSFVFNFSSSLAIPMGLTTAIFYLIPMFGQFIGGTLVTLVLLFSNPIAAIVFAVIYIIYAQIENNLISPKIQGNALRLPVVAVLSALVVGMYMFGFLGAIIAVPIAGCLRILIDEYPNFKKAAKSEA